jgi:multidrug transporter EmrE-like cation transporter
VLAFALLSQALKTIEVGVAYAFWVPESAPPAIT